jgi:hypothetical protein
MQKLVFIIFISTIILACKNGKKLPNVSNIKVNATIHRFDEAFFDEKISIAQKLPKLQKEYGRILDYFMFNATITDRVQMGMNMDAVIEEFTKIHKPLYDTAQLMYKDLGFAEKEIAKGFQYYKYYFPNFKEPKMFSIVDGFYPDDPSTFFGALYNNDTLIVRLQMFLGKDFSGYDPQIYYDYLRLRFEKEYLVKNVFTEIINKKFPAIEPGSTLIDNIIDAGKRIYLLDQILPDKVDEIKLGYTKQQLKMCYENEMNIWSHFVNNDILFNVEPSIIKSYVGENPFTKEIGPEIVGNVGAFVGWQIVKKFVTKNKGISPAKLMEMDNKRIYTEAKYKPS